MAGGPVEQDLIKKLVQEVRDEFGELLEYDAELHQKDPISAKLAQFRKLSPNADAKAEVKLKGLLQEIWEKALLQNQALGGKVKETRQETREADKIVKSVPIGGKGFLAKVTLRQEKLYTDERTVTTTVRGDVQESEWVPSSALSTRYLEDAFENLRSVPVLCGVLKKLTSDKLRKCVTLKLGQWQERNVVVKEGHLVWWKSRRSGDDEVNGAVNFLINQAVVEPDPVRENAFHVRPAERAGWADTSCFGGGNTRSLTFCVVDDNGPNDVTRVRDQWVAAIRKNIAFAKKASEQIGIEKVRTQVSCKMPTVERAEFGVKLCRRR